jgi:hypothetical protein|tara:strand:+ start:3032 stop:5374 length:2343 start_codon:yes stop_codon:yes gene_type:complete
MAVEDNIQVTQEEVDAVEPVDVEITDEAVEPEQVQEEAQDFYVNLAEGMDERILASMANELLADYKKDKESRGDWEKSYTSGLDLLGFKYNNESGPFQGASSVTHPMLAESVTQFQAQAYKELLPSDGPVSSKVVGALTPEKEAQAQRVEEFMNYMITEEMEEYTPEFDQLLFYLPLAGSAFKKVYFDDVLQRAISKFVPAEDLVVPYYATDLKDCERITHLVRMSENDILKKQQIGFYRDVDILPSRMEDSEVQDKYNELSGQNRSGDAEGDYQFNVLEMHVDLDLVDPENKSDEKNIKIPYIVTLDEGSREILSIYRNFEPDDPLLKRKEFFVHYKFLPGLGFYGFGLIHMIGGLSKTATASLRQLLDAGTLANLPAGFKTRGMRIRDDDQPFQPGEFRDVDIVGGRIQDSFMQLPFKEPSQTLFQLLGFVVQAGQRFAAIADMQVGEDGKNRAVGTTVALLERGSRVMSAIHKRCYYAMRQEFRLLNNVFASYLPPVYPYAVYGGDRMVKQADFSPEVDVIPVADPNIFSMSQRVTLAQTQLQIAQSNPQMHNVHEAYRRVYAALGTKDINTLLKKQEEPQPKDPALENADALAMKPLKVFEFQNHDAHIFAHMAFMKTRMVQMNPQVYALLQAHISEHISFKAKAQALILIQQEQPDVMQLQQTDPEGFRQVFDGVHAERIQVLTEELVEQEQPADDPLVRLKQQELDMRAADMQRKGEEFLVQEQRKADEFDQRIDLDKMEREDSEDAGKERIRVADDKLDIMRDKLKQDTGKDK